MRGTVEILNAVLKLTLLIVNGEIGKRGESRKDSSLHCCVCVVQGYVLLQRREEASSFKDVKLLKIS